MRERNIQRITHRKKREIRRPSQPQNRPVNRGASHRAHNLLSQSHSVAPLQSAPFKAYFQQSPHTKYRKMTMMKIIMKTCIVFCWTWIKSRKILIKIMFSTSTNRNAMSYWRSEAHGASAEFIFIFCSMWSIKKAVSFWGIFRPTKPRWVMTVKQKKKCGVISSEFWIWKNMTIKQKKQKSEGSQCTFGSSFSKSFLSVIGHARLNMKMSDGI